MRDDGVVSGSVSGGCVEDDLIARTKRGFKQSADGDPVQDKPTVITYGVTKDEATRFGLPCGGTLRLVQEPLLDVTRVAQLMARTAAHQLVTRTLTLATGVVQLEGAIQGQPLYFDGEVLTTVFGPKWRLLLIGAGQLSQAVAQMACMLDFDVLICDPREEYAATLSACTDRWGWPWPWVPGPLQKLRCLLWPRLCRSRTGWLQRLFAPDFKHFGPLAGVSEV